LATQRISPELPAERSATAAAGGAVPDAWRRERIDVGGVPVDRVTEAQVIAHILERLDAGRGGWVVTPNLDHLRRARRDPQFAGMLAEADLSLADGMPLVWASRLQGTPLPERVAGSTMTSTLAGAAAEAGRSLYLLGGDPGAADGAAKVLLKRYPSLTIAGTACPKFGFEQEAATFDRITEAVADASPDIVYVALGSPKQERVIRRMRAAVPGAWWLGVGISLSFLCGQVRRAPGWMQRSGLEWTHRLAQEPGRLGKRYLVDGLPFAARLLAGAGWRRVGGVPAAAARPVDSVESGEAPAVQ